MILPTRSDLKALIEDDSAGARVSMYLPTHRAGREIQQDPVRLQNLIRAAEQRLIENGLRAPEVRALLEPARKLITDPFFWRYQLEGLALFVSPDKFSYYQVPFSFEDLMVVSHRYHLKPLLRWFTGDGTYYLLALSQKDIRLFEGSRFGVGELDFERAPESLSEALQEEAPQKEIRLHTRAQSAGESRAAMFHGQGPGGEHKKDALLRYFRIVNDALVARLSGESSPLVLASVDYYLPIYREANTYPHLVQEVVPGNPEGMSGEKLHERVWTLLTPRFARDREAAAAQYRALSGAGRATADLKEGLLAAHRGRVATMFVPVGVRQWGRMNPEKWEIEKHETQEPGDHDLLDLAAIHTLLNGGTVYAVEPWEMPEEGAVMAAVFRY